MKPIVYELDKNIHDFYLNCELFDKFLWLKNAVKFEGSEENRTVIYDLFITLAKEEIEEAEFEKDTKLLSYLTEVLNYLKAIKKFETNKIYSL